MEKEKRETFIGIALFAILLGGAFISLVMGGFSSALYFVVFGVPVIFVILLVMYIIKSKVSPGERPEVITRRKELDKKLDSILGIKRQMKKIKDSGLNVDVSGVEFDINDRLSNLETKFGCVIRNETPLRAEYDSKLVLDSRSQDIVELGTGLEKNEHMLNDNLVGALKGRVEVYLNKLKELKDIGYDVDSYIDMMGSDYMTDNLNNSLSSLENKSKIFEDALDSSFEKTRNNINQIQERGLNASTAQNNLTSAVDAKSSGELLQSHNMLLQAIKESSSALSTDFDKIREDLLNSLGTVISSSDLPFVKDEEKENLNKLREEATSADSPVYLQKINSLKDETIESTRSLLERLYIDLEKAKNQIISLSPPTTFWQEEKVGPIYEECIESTKQGDIKTISEKFQYAMQDIGPKFQNTSNKLKILKTYQNLIAPSIEDKLKEHGVVSIDDIGVKKDVEEFIELYLHYHPEITYDSINKELRTEGGPTESVGIGNMVMTVTDTEKNPLPSVTVELEKSFGGKMTEITDTEGRAFFKEVKPGMYHVKVLSQNHSVEEGDLEITGDNEFEIELKEKSLIEKLCKGKEEKVQKLLELHGDSVSAEFEKAGFLTSHSDVLQINPEFKPCFLFMWSQGKEGIKLSQIGNEYHVYKSSLIKQELITTINNINPELKSRISLELDIKAKYLSVPLPVSEIRDIINELISKDAFDHDLELSDDYLNIRK